jgi:16S rRNA (cytosine1402-N4)-methyltransferase
MLFTQPTPALEAVRNTAAPAALAQVPALGTLSNAVQDSALGTARGLVKSTDARATSGWLLARRPVTFQTRRGKFLGTGLFACFESMVRAASGWLSARPSQGDFPAQDSALGTARGLVKSTDVRAASGWLSARRPVTFNMAGCMGRPATGTAACFQTMVRVLSGVFSARPSEISSEQQDAALGTARRTAFESGSRAASGWLSARVPEDFHTAGEAGEAYHLPVFPAEVGQWMQAAAGKWIIDGTLGGGGHSEIFLQAGAAVLGIDRDPEALAHARARLAAYGGRFTTWEGNFSDLHEIPGIQQGERADGLLLDLGVSSRQLDSAARGFSFLREGPLDMRMGPGSRCSAADIVNGWGDEELAKMIFELGEEPRARRIAAAIVKRRGAKPFETTTELAECIEQAVGRHGRTHPATRAFQAIRMAVNDELGSLAAALAAAPKVLKPGGRLLVITFHSLEDRMVKRFLRQRSAPFIDDPGWPEPRPNPDRQFELLARKAIVPSAEEISRNPRARSAKLRVARLLDPAA